VLENKHTAADKLSYWSKVDSEDKKKKNINDFINSQLNIIRMLNSKLNELKSEILESEYSLKY